VLEDHRLVQRLRRGDRAALRCIYEKYKDDLLTIGTCLLVDVAAAEDVLHDVFVAFAGGIDGFQLRSSLRGYLATCVANRARDELRKKSRRDIPLADVGEGPASTTEPATQLIDRQETQRLYRALAELPDEQREAITLHLHGGMRFNQIARHQEVSINTVQSRYRYGLEKLRSLLNTGVRS